MRRTSFNDHWTVGAKVNSFAEIDHWKGFGACRRDPAPRRPDRSHRSPAGQAATAYFPSGSWRYTKALELAPEDEDAAVILEFEGVYRDASVRVNGTLAAQRPNGYADFTVQIDHLLHFDRPNEITVDARAHDDSRWYSGAGIYRNVWLLRGPRVHLVPGSLQVSTPEIDDDVAVVAVAVVVQNQSTTARDAVLRLEVLDRDGTVVAGAEAPVSTVPGDALVARQRLCVQAPHRWGPDDPYLYTCRATLLEDDKEPQNAITMLPRSASAPCRSTPCTACGSTGRRSCCGVRACTTTTGCSVRPPSTGRRNAGSSC